MAEQRGLSSSNVSKAAQDIVSLQKISYKQDYSKQAMAKKREIRNSTVEFLTFVAEGKENGIQVLYKDETIWATQKAMAVLFDVGIPAINKHLVNIFADGELRKEATVSKMEIVQTEGNRDVKRMMELYNLDAIISVGYRVNSIRATQFRQWCTYVIRHFSLRGYIIDKKRMENALLLTRIISSICFPRSVRFV